MENPMTRILLKSVLLVILTVSTFTSLHAQRIRVVEAPVAEDVEKEEPKKEKNSENGQFLTTPDRGIMRRLDQTEQLLDRERYTEAIQMLGAILEGETDFFLEDSDNPENRTTRKTLKQQAEKLLRDLPEDAKSLYSMQYDPKAKRLLDDSIKTGSIETLEKVADRYFYTESGPDAMFLLGMYHFEQGENASALIAFKRLVDENVNLDPYEPTFSLSLATSELRLGKKDDAVKTLEAFLRRHPNPKLRISGEDLWMPKNPDDILERIEKWNVKPDISQWLLNTGWLTPSGTPWENVSLDASVPLLRMEWRSQIIREARMEKLAAQLEREISMESSNAYIPAGIPLLVGDLLIFKGYDNVSAVHMNSGKRAWKNGRGEELVFTLPDNAKDLFQLQEDQQFNQNFMFYGQPQVNVLGRLFRLVLWHNRTLARITSDGNLIYSVEDPEYIERTSSQSSQMMRVRNFRNQNLILEDPRSKFGNSLVARDVKTGEIVWHVGKYQLGYKQIELQTEKFLIEQERLKREAEEKAKTTTTTVPDTPDAPAVPILPPAGGRNVIRINRINPLPIPPPAPLLVEEIECEDIDIFDDFDFDTAVPVLNEATATQVIVTEDTEEIVFEENPEKTTVAETTTTTADSPEAPETPAEIPPADSPVKKTDVEPKKVEPILPKTVITPSEQFLGETYFLGPPLPLRDRLYQIGENGGIIRLLILNAKTGTLLRHQSISQPEQSLEQDFQRQFGGITPAYSEGILVCPTGSGVLAAVEARTGKPLWCTTYYEAPPEDENANNNRAFIMMNRNRNNIMMYLMSPQLQFSSLFETSGWFNPSTTIIEGKIVFAPSDQPYLFCIDMLSGEILWKRPRGTGIYVACVHGDKILIVAPDSVTAVSLENGRSYWEDHALKPVASTLQVNPYGGGLMPINLQRRAGRDPFGEEDPNAAKPEFSDADGLSATGVSKDQLPVLTFPKDVHPCGLGVHNDGIYFLPMDDNRIIAIDIENGKIESSWNTFREGNLGNLLAFQGKIFSQTVGSIDSFDQIEALRDRAEKLLAQNPNDPKAFLDLGRISLVDSKFKEAINYFKRSIESQKNIENTGLLREAITEALREDFSAWKHEFSTLMQYSDTPETKAQSLYAYSIGLQNAKDWPEFTKTLEELIVLDRLNHIMLKDIESGTYTQRRLSNWINEQIGKYADHPNIGPVVARIAQEEYDKILEIDRTESDNTDVLLGSSVRESPLERQWKAFLEHFESLPISSKVRSRLLDSYERRGAIGQMESLITSDFTWHDLMNAAEIEEPEPEPEPEYSLEDFFGDAPKDDDLVGTPGNDLPPETETKESEKPNDEPRIDQNALLVQSELPNGIYRLARAMEKAGRYSDALFYYTILKNRWGDITFMIDLENPEDLRTGTDIFFGIRSNSEIQNLLKGEKWPFGNVVFKKKDIGDTSAKTQSTNSNRMFLEYVGEYNPFLSKYSFHLESAQSTFLVCTDEFAREQWRFMIAERRMNNNIRVQQQIHFSGNNMASLANYLTGNNHFLYYIDDQTVFAFDMLQTEPTGAPKLLWKKEIANELPPLRYMNNPFRTIYMNSIHFVNGVQVSNFPVSNSRIYAGGGVFCYIDDNMYALDPYTGETLWVYDSAQPDSIVFGDGKYIYLAQPSRTEYRILDIRNGKELAYEKLPDNAFAFYGSNLVTIGNDSRNNSIPLQLFDLKSILKDEHKKGSLPTCIARIETQRNNDNLVHIQEHGRYVGVVKSRSLTLLDALNGEVLFTVAPPSHQQMPSSNNIIDFNVQSVDEDILITFIYNSNNNNRVGQLTFSSPFTNTRTKFCGMGIMMLYSKDGKRKWEKGVPLRNCHTTQYKSDQYPFITFAARVNENVSGRSHNYVTLKAIDKRTGELRFSKKFGSEYGQPNSNIAQITSFTLHPDPVNHSIDIVAPKVIFTGKFTNYHTFSTKKEVSSANKAYNSISEISRAIPRSVLFDSHFRNVSEEFKSELYDRVFGDYGKMLEKSFEQIEETGSSKVD